MSDRGALYREQHGAAADGFRRAGLPDASTVKMNLMLTIVSSPPLCGLKRLLNVKGVDEQKRHWFA